MPPSSYSNVTHSLESVCGLKDPEDSMDPREDSLPVSGQESPLIFFVDFLHGDKQAVNLLHQMYHSSS